MADMTEVYDALRKADAAGDTEGAKKLAAYISSQGVNNQSEQSSGTPPQEPSLLDRLKAKLGDPVRGAGLTARAALEGAGDVYSIIGKPIQSLTGGAVQDIGGKASQFATDIGLPTPETPTEKVVNAASRGLVGAGTMTGTGMALSRAPSLAGQFGEVLASQPAAQLTSGALGGGSAEAAKQAGMGEKAQLAAGILGALAPSGAAIFAPRIGAMIADVVGGVGTHTGGEPLRQAARSGLQGGKAEADFIANMRGDVPAQNVLEDVKANLAEMGRQKSAQYRSGMADISNDKSVLDFNGIDKTLVDQAKDLTYKGQSINDAAAKKLTEVSDIIGDWKNLNPAEYHTPEGLDALKKRVGAVLETIDPVNDKTAYRAVSSVYNSIKNEITDQAPTYAKVMGDYTDATQHITDIEKALSVGKKASADTSMRKLQSLMRNNANTNYGNRLALAKSMEQQGGNEIMPAIAGQALSSVTPRGIGGATTGLLGLGSYGVGGAPLAVPLLAAQSPRLMGEAALKAGQAARFLNNAGGGVANKNALSAMLQAAQYGTLGANQ